MSPKKIIIVDDDTLNNFIIRQNLLCIDPDFTVMDFSNPVEGWKYVSNYTGGEAEKVILFLDLNMPEINGWDFLEKFDRLDERIKNAFEIYIVSSSLDENDMIQAENNFNVKEYYIKPIQPELLKEITSLVASSE